MINRKVFWGTALLSLTSLGHAYSTPSAEPAGSVLDNRLMPQPATIKSTGSQFALPQDFSVRFDGPADARLHSAVQRTINGLHTRFGVDLREAETSTAALTVHVQSSGPVIQTVDDDERYRLAVASTGITLSANTDIGAIRGLQTLVQLVQPSEGHFIIPGVQIDDAPRFRWRGLLVDCSRHFEPVTEIKRTLDAMEAVKLNVFHWHLSDDQGFRIESKVFPKLTEVGSGGLFYSQQEVRDVVAYAHDRGIRVVPEFEMPGHSTAWLVAYPELSSGAPPTGIRHEFGISPYAVDPTREETYQFIDRFLSEMVTLFPDAYVHIGGDETTAPDWKTNTRIQAFMHAHDLQDSAALQAYFNQRVLKILTRLHRHMIGWDEIFNPALPKDIVIQTWRGEASMTVSSAAGYQGILSAGYYLDGMQSAEQHYLVDPAPSAAALTPQQRNLILGGEVAMWSEFVNERTIDSRIWPRAAAIAERYWSPESVRDIDDMYCRLDAVSVQLEGLGIQHISHQDSALRALVGTQDVGALSAFASVLEPSSFHERFDRKKALQKDPLIELSDAVRPDPPARHEFALLTKEFLAAPQQNGAVKQQLEAHLRILAEAAPVVTQQVNAAPGLADARLRAQQLSGLANAGLQAIDALSSGAAKSSEWRVSALALIAEAEKPSANLRFVFLAPLKALVTAVKQ